MKDPRDMAKDMGRNMGQNMGQNMPGAMGNLPSNELNRVLRDVNFPADKNRLRDVARQNNAPETVIRMIDQLPSRQFSSPRDVEQAFGGARK